MGMANQCDTERQVPRVVVAGLASCFGCQVQMTNMEAHLLKALGQIDLQYWQLVSSDPLPDSYDLAIIEGAVTTEASVETVKRLRDQAKVVIAIGACANTGGIPGMAATNFDQHVEGVYKTLPGVCADIIAPRSVKSVIDVDYSVSGCPLDPDEFLDILARALYGSNKTLSTKTMCGDCKRNENTCFFEEGTLCLGLVTLAGCGARCPTLGKPCIGCRGISPDANLVSAYDAVERFDVSASDLEHALELFNHADVAPVCLIKDKK